jgi:hypothetical protein
MSYAVVLTQAAAEDLARINPLCLEPIQAELSRLAGNPIDIGRRAHFPYPRGQMHQFRCIAGGEEHLVTILFRFADVRSENVIGIGNRLSDNRAAG